MAALTFREAQAAIQKGAPERTAPRKIVLSKLSKATPLADFEGEALRAEFVRRARAANRDLSETDAIRSYAALNREDYLLYLRAARVASLVVVSRRGDDPAAKAEPTVQEAFDAAIEPLKALMVADGVAPEAAFGKVAGLPSGWYGDRRAAIGEAQRNPTISHLLRRAEWWSTFCHELAARARSEVRKSGARQTHQQVLERLLNTRGPLGGGRVV